MYCSSLLTKISNSYSFKNCLIFQHLKGLCLKYNSLGAYDYIRLSPVIETLTNIVSLDISCNGLSFYSSTDLCDSFASSMAKLNHLQRLDLSSSRIRTKLGQLLRLIPCGLTFLRLVGCCLAVSDITYLSLSHHSGTLSELELCDNDLSQCTSQLSRLLSQGQHNLLSLELEYCRLTDANMLSLLPSFRDLKVLLAINLGHYYISHQVIISLIHTLSQNASVKVIKIGYPSECTLGHENDEDIAMLKEDCVNLYKMGAELTRQNMGMNKYPIIVIVGTD